MAHHATYRSAGLALALLACAWQCASGQAAHAHGEATPAPQHYTSEPVGDTRRNDRGLHVHVVVEDAAGHPVNHLREEDLSLFDNGVPRPVLAFTQETPVSEHAFREPVEVVLVLDAMNTSFPQMVTVRQAVEHYLREGGGHLAVPVSIVLLTETDAQVKQPSRDGGELAAELRTLPTPPHVLSRAQDPDAVLQHFQRSVDTLSMLTRYEARRPGRKLLVWIGAGWPLLANPAVKTRDDSQQNLFRSIVDLSSGLRNAQITLYSITPLDAGMNQAPPGLAYREHLRPVTNAGQATAADLAVQVLAVQSGGLAIGPTGDIQAALGQVVADLFSSYELTFVPPPDAHPGSYHGLHITLQRPGLAARTVAGYYAGSPAGPTGTASR